MESTGGLPPNGSRMVSVIVCTYNRSGSLKKTLDSLREMQIPPAVAWELIVVDNNSTDETERVVKNFRNASALDVRYVFEPEQGHSHARNRGIRESKGDILAFIDDDATVDRFWLEQLDSTYSQDDCIGVGGRIVPVWTGGRPGWLGNNGRYPLKNVVVTFDLGDQPCVLNTPPYGANMSFKRIAFERYGGFRTDLGRKGRGMLSGEDTEFGRRLLRNGERLIYSPTLAVYHPVEKERATKRYYLRWYFNYGRTSTILARLTDDLGHHGRAQRKLFRSLLACFLRWVCACDPERRFYYKLKFYEALGRIAQVYKTLPTEADHLVGNRQD